MTATLREAASRALVEAQMALDDGDPVSASRHALKAWGECMRLAYPPKPDATLERLLKGEGA